MMKPITYGALFLAGAAVGAGGVSIGLAQATPRPAVQSVTQAGAPPPGLREALAGTCPGYNAALVEAAALSLRINKPQEASRLMEMRQPCGETTPGYYRSSGGTR